MTFAVDHERLTEVARWRPFFTNDRFREQDEEHLQKLNLAGEFAREYRGLPALDRSEDELAAFRPGRKLRDEIRRRKRVGEQLPVWLETGDWERVLTKDWSWPGNVTEPSSLIGVHPLAPEQFGPPRPIFRFPPKRTKLLLPHDSSTGDPNTGKPLAPDRLGPPHPIYRNVEYYDGMIPLVALVWWQRTEDEWRKPNSKGVVKKRPPVGVSHIKRHQSPTSENERTGLPSGRRGRMDLLFKELFTQAGVCHPPSARQIERLVEELRDAEFPKED